MRLIKKRPEKTDDKSFDDSVVGTMKINPREYKAVEKNVDELERTKYAFAGVLYLIRHEKTVRQIMLTSMVMLGLIVWLQIDVVPAVIVFLSLGVVWITEALNTAVEAVVDLVTQDIHPMAKVAKDVAAAATLAATFTSSTVCLTLLGPPLLQQLGIA